MDTVELTIQFKGVLYTRTVRAHTTNSAFAQFLCGPEVRQAGRSSRDFHLVNAKRTCRPKIGAGATDYFNASRNSGHA